MELYGIMFVLNMLKIRSTNPIKIIVESLQSRKARWIEIKRECMLKIYQSIGRELEKPCKIRVLWYDGK